jgi:hypothetical protein
MSRLTTVFLMLVMSFGVMTTASAQHSGDIFLDVIDGRIVTGKVNPDQSVELDVRVFGATFGDSGFPGYTDSPGFDAPAGTFPIGTKNGFNVLEGWTVWNGDGFEPADGEMLQIWLQSLSVIVEDEPVPGFEVNVSGNGGWHIHYNYLILGPDEDDPLPGIYLLEMELYNTSTSVQPSKPFWKVFNFNMPSAVHQEAMQWVIDNMLDADDCLGDINGDGAVDGADLLMLLSDWGSCAGDCASDLNGDGIVDGADLLLLLSAWGQCPAT